MASEASQPPQPAQLNQLSASNTPTTGQPSLSRDVAASADTSVVNGDLPSVEVVETHLANGGDAIIDDQNLVSSPVEEPSSETLADAKDQESKASTDHALEAALQEAVRADADSHGQEADEMDIEDFYAPDPGQLAPQTPIHVHDQTGSPAYSPTLDRTIPDATQQESDDYEPPEATPPADEQFAPDSPPFSPAPPEIVSEVVDNENPDVDMPEFEPATAANDVEQCHSEENLPSTNGRLSQVVEVHNTFTRTFQPSSMLTFG